jgi:putative ABC transport system permease protein
MLESLRTHLLAVTRGLRSSRALVAVAVLTLAAAIGMNVAMFGLIDRALLSPARHLRDPGNVFTVAFETSGPGGVPLRMTTTSYPTFGTLREQLKLGAIAAWQLGPSSVVVGDEQVDADTMLVSDGYFELVGAAPQLGRTFTAGHAGNAAVISHAFWRSTFRGDTNVLGRRVKLSGVEFQITGVMPRGFSGHAPANVDVWLPIETAMSGTPGWDNPYRRVLSIVARVPAAQAPAAAARATEALGRTVVFVPISGDDVGTDERRIAYWLGGVSAVVLLIGLANATTLLMVRAARRRRELAIRAALGASRGQLFAHLAIESLLIGLSAAAASLILAYWLDEAVRGVLLPGIVERDGADPRTLLGASAAGLIAAGLAVAAGIRGVSAEPRAPISTEGLSRHLAQGLSFSVARGMSPSVARTFSPAFGARVPLSSALLVVQTMLSVLLLAGAGMFGRSLHMLLSQDFGMRLDGVLVVDFEQGAGSIPGKDEMLRTALDRIRGLPGVAAATTYEVLPFTGFHVPPIAVPGRPQPSVDRQLPFLIAATPELFDILDIRITDGRRFTPSDDRGPLVVIVNETMAREVWPGERAIGRCIRVGFDPDFDPATAAGPAVPSDAVPCREVIGVARDTRQRSIVPSGIETRLMQYYVPFPQIPPMPAAFGATGPHVGGLLVRSAVGVDSLIVPIRRIVMDGRTDLPTARVRPYAALFEQQARPWRLGSTLLTMFSALAIGTAAVGLYAAFAHAVTMRRREIAIRMAIGATAGSVKTMIVRDAAALTLIGTAGGLLAAFAAGRSLRSLLFGIAPADPIVLAGTAIAMLTVTVLAAALPARSAARTDPNTLLRAE